MAGPSHEYHEQVVNARGVKQRAAALHTVHFITFIQQKLVQIGPVLASNSSD